MFSFYSEDCARRRTPSDSSEAAAVTGPTARWSSISPRAKAAASLTQSRSSPRAAIRGSTDSARPATQGPGSPDPPPRDVTSQFLQHLGTCNRVPHSLEGHGGVPALVSGVKVEQPTQPRHGPGRIRTLPDSWLCRESETYSPSQRPQRSPPTPGRPPSAQGRNPPTGDSRPWGL